MIGPLGLTIHTLGEVLVAVTALSVHHRVKHEHKIDKAVFQSMQTEQVFGVLGVLLILVGWSLEIYAHFVPGLS